MKPARLALLAVAASSAAIAQTAAPAPAPAAPASFTDALLKGKPSLNARLRYETADQDGLQDADALTLRVRAGYTTKAYNGFQAMIEGEANVPLARDYFDGTGTNTVPPTATIADPEIYELNQAWISYAHEKTKGTLGRQRIVLDNARFIGDVAWRQNQQTFDAFLLQDKTIDKLTLTYGYLDRINRIFDDRSAQYDWDSDSHVLHASYTGLPFGTLTGYAYLLDFSADGVLAGINAAKASSSQTYGLSLTGARPVTDALKATYRLEYATQSDYGSSTVVGGYDADYYVVELGLAAKKYSFAVGYEVLGSDSGAVGFKTPLATMHAFNGWADKFLGTPNAGLTDLYLKASATLPGNVSLLAFYHEFGTTEGASDIGSEIDIQLSYKVNKNISLLAKAAFYQSESPVPVAGSTAAHQDTNKFSFQIDYAY